MDNYTDMKFEGDLSFLNEHLELARRKSKNAPDANDYGSDKDRSAVNQGANVPTNSYFENTGIFSYNLTSQANVNVVSKWNLNKQAIDLNNESEKFNSNFSSEVEKNIEDNINSPSTKGFQDSSEFAPSENEESTTEFDQFSAINSHDSQSRDGIYPKKNLNDVVERHKIDSENLGYKTNFDQREQVGSDYDLQTRSSSYKFDKYNNGDLEHYDKVFDQSEKINSPDIQNTEGSSSRKNFLETIFHEFSGSDGERDSASFEQLENFETANGYDNVKSFQNNKAFYADNNLHNRINPDPSYKSNLFNKEIADDSKKRNFLETILHEFNDSESNVSSTNFEQLEVFESDNNFNNSRNSQYNYEFYAEKDLYRRNQFDRNEIMENRRNIENNDIWQSSRNMQEPNVSRLNNIPSNQGMDNFDHLERFNTTSNFQRESNYLNSNQFDTRNAVRQNAQFDNSGSNSYARSSESWQNARKMHESDSIGFNNLESSQNYNNFDQAGTLNSNHNFQSPVNYRINDEFSDRNDLRYRNQFDQPEKMGHFRDTENNDRFQNSSNLNKGTAPRNSSFDSNRSHNDFDHLGASENVSNFQESAENKNIDEFNNIHNMRSNKQFEQSEKNEYITNIHNNDSFYNSRISQSQGHGRSNSAQNNMSSDHYEQLERLRSNTNMNSASNYKYSDDFNNSKDLGYNTQFEKSNTNRYNSFTPNQESFRNSRNFQDSRLNEFNNSEFNQNGVDFSRPQQIKNDSNFQNPRNYRNTDEFNYNNDFQYRKPFDQSENTENLKNFQNNANFQNDQNIDHANDKQHRNSENSVNSNDHLYNRNERNEMNDNHNPSDIDYTASAQYERVDNISQHSESNNYVAEASTNNQVRPNEDEMNAVTSKSNADVNIYTVNEFEEVKPSIKRRKSQLEVMLRNSGFDMELFNNFKEELLEIEKDNIIMKYKQELMMTILKS